MSNKDVAIYMIPAGCTLTALLVAESCYDNGMLWLPIMLLAIAGIVVFAKKKKGASAHEKLREADAEFNNISRKNYITQHRRYGRAN